MTITIPNTDEIRAAVRDELAAFFSNFQLQPNTEPDEIGGVEFAAKIIDKAVPTVYSLCHQRVLPHSKRGKQLYFSKKELLQWLADGKRKTVSEIKNEAAKF